MRLVTKITGVFFLIIAIGFSGGVPFLATQLNNLGCGLVRAGYSTPARYIFAYVSIFGDANALNNIGVLYRRGLSVDRNVNIALDYFRQAIIKGNVAARYNFTDSFPNRFEFHKKLFKEQVSLLNRNILEGDIHSNVLLAHLLRFGSRSEIVPNREARKLEVLETAANSGDRDYMYIYAKELWDQARGEREDSAMALRAIPILKKVLNMGEPRAAEVLNNIKSSGEHWIDISKAPEFFAIDALHWDKRAAELGLIAGKCGYSLGSYKWLKPEFISYSSRAPIIKPKVQPPAETLEDRASKKQPEVQVPIEHPERGVDNLTQQQHDEARKYLRECANYENTRRKAALPFGNPALYGYKRVAIGYTVAFSLNWARLYLGLIYLEGIGTEPDLDEARKYFNLAKIDHKSDKAQKYLDMIDEMAPKKQ